MDAGRGGAYAQLREVRPVSDTTRLRALTEAGVLHPNPDWGLAPVEAAQVDYETLRAHVCENSGLPEGLAAARFARRGLAGLIAWPSAEPVFVAELLTATRPAWTPHDDPRVAALAAGYQFLLDAVTRVDSVAALALPGRGLW